MSEFERQVYADMKSVDRVLLYMAKAHELIEFVKAMTREDINLLRDLIKEMDGMMP